MWRQLLKAPRKLSCSPASPSWPSQRDLHCPQLQCPCRARALQVSLRMLLALVHCWAAAAQMSPRDLEVHAALLKDIACQHLGSVAKSMLPSE